MKQATGAQVVDIGERPEEEKPLDAGREADQVQQERPAVAAGYAFGERRNGIDPPETELCLASDRGDIVDCGKCLRALRPSGR